MNEFVFMMLLVIVYFLPGIVAAAREHRSSNSIFLTNLFFGWTFIGWAIALIWAFGDTGKVHAKEVQEAQELKVQIAELNKKLETMQQKDEA